MVDQVARRALLTVLLGHRPQLLTDAAQPSGSPLLLFIRLVPEPGLGLVHQATSLSAGLAGDLPALFGGGVGELVADLRTALGDLRALLLDPIRCRLLFASRCADVTGFSHFFPLVR